MYLSYITLTKFLDQLIKSLEFYLKYNTICYSLLIKFGYFSTIIQSVNLKFSNSIISK